MERINRQPRRSRYQLSPTQMMLGLLVLLPLYFFCSRYISSAFVKILARILGGQVTYNTLVVYLNCFNDLLIAVVGLLVLWKYVKPQFQDAAQHSGHILAVGMIQGMIMMYMALAVGNMFVSIFSSTTTSVNESTIRTLMRLSPAVMAITTVILAPVAEELVFRGFIFGALRPVNRVLAYLISAFTFGFVHVSSSVMSGNFAEMIQMIPYFLMGLVLCYMFDQEDNISASIITHITNNLISTIIMLFLSL